MYTVEIKSAPRANWRAAYGARAFPTLEEAKAFAASFDEDGCIMGNVRIRHTATGLVPRHLYTQF